MSSEPVDIGDVITELCSRFGYEKASVTDIHFEPTALTFTVLEYNEHGRPFIRDGQIVNSTHSFKVTT